MEEEGGGGRRPEEEEEEKLTNWKWMVEADRGGGDAEAKPEPRAEDQKQEPRQKGETRKPRDERQPTVNQIECV